MEASESELNGTRLYGDDLPPEKIAEWYTQEENGYLELLTDHYRTADRSGNYVYEYDALNRFHALNHVARRRFACCVALGCAAGSDVAPIAPIVQKFIGIEPSEKWWRSEIAGTPAVYLKPSVLGDLPLGDGSADLATSFGVLHHIPNVTHVLGEVARVLQPGGLFIVREPISWMGDWRKPRPGLTRNERGVPLGWFERHAAAHGLRVLRRRLCMFSGSSLLAKKLGISSPYSSTAVVVADWILSEGLRWNLHYRRDSALKKIAPGSAFWIMQRRPD